MLEDDDIDEKVMASMEEKWEWEEMEAVVDSGSVDTVTNPKRLPGHRIVETQDAKSGAHWTCAGDTKIPKLGMIRLPWQTNDGTNQRTEMMVGAVGKTLVSTHRLDESGFDTLLTRINPRLVNRDSGEVIQLKKKGRLHYLSMWVKVKRDALVANVNKKEGAKVEAQADSNERQPRVFRRLAPARV